jgi:hypothetical protein
MSTRWYPSSEEVVVPWNARYNFPSQANRATKMTPKISPENNDYFVPGQVMRFEFPAQGYLNPINTTLAFDVTLIGYGTSVGKDALRFQNNIQTLFSRVRVMYGATPLEDIIDYNLIVRSLTEWTGSNQTGKLNQDSISQGIGGVIAEFNTSTTKLFAPQNVRQRYIQGLDITGGASPKGFYVPNTAAGNFPSELLTSTEYCTRRYSVNLQTGLFTQDKLIPIKYMASQLAVEITLEDPVKCIFRRDQTTGSDPSGTTPTYVVSRCTMIPEILEFDATYDAMFVKGLQRGVPIHFSSWHTYKYDTYQSAQVNLQIPERSRSVRALFAVQTKTNPTILDDAHATFFDSSFPFLSTGSTMQEYQWRIGGRFFPNSPVQLSLSPGSVINNGGAEAYTELSKAMITIGKSVGTSANSSRWAVSVVQLSGTDYLPNMDYTFVFDRYETGGTMVVQNTNVDRSYGMMGSSCFASAIDLETSNGAEIAGLNAEEQSDITFIAKWSRPQGTTFAMTMTVFSYFDCMLVLKENNVVELVL